MTATSHISASAFGHPVAFLSGLADRFIQYRNYRKTVQILSALTAAELDDLGLERATLPEAAHKAVYGV